MSLYPCFWQAMASEKIIGDHSDLGQDRRKNMPEWNAEAQRTVAHVAAELSEAHRGAFLWHAFQGEQHA